MKNKTACIIICVFTGILICFTCGFFTGRANRGITISAENISSSEIPLTEDNASETEVNSDTVKKNTESNSSGQGKFVNVVNINTADEEELQILPGIGEVIANRIVAYRTENGPFSSPEDICNVEGIGDVTFDKIKNMILV